MSDQTPEQVRRLGEIHLLIINRPTITEAHTAVLKDVKNAKRLLLCSRQINASAVKHVRECAGLKWLKFYNQSVTDKWLQELGPVTQLEYLFVRGDEITDAGVAFLRGMTELRELHLFSDSLTDAGLVHLGSLKNLRVLRLHGSLLTGTGLVHLQDMSEMTELHVSGSLTDAGLAHLATLKNLQVLRLHSGAITGSGIAELKPLTNLERLSIGSRITNDNLIQLKLLSNLKALHLSSQKITDAGLVHLTALRNLEGLHLDETNVTAEGEATLRRSLPKCEIKRSGSSAQDVRVKLTPGVFRDGRQWLSVRVVNDSTDKVATLEPGGFPLRILVNGVAYRPKWSDSTRTRETEPRIIRPGTGNNGGEFTLDRNWVADDTGQKLELKPGRNAIRAIVHVTVKDAPEGDNELHYLSNTVAVDADGRAEDMQSVRLRVLGGAAKKPLAGLELTLTPSGWETGVTAMTDEDGSATFTLLPNTYKIALRSSKELPYLRFAAEQPHRGIYHRHITVAETPGDQQFDVNLYDPCELVLRAVDVETGKGVPGVAFVTENVAAEMWAEPIFNDTLGPGPRWSDLPIDHKSFLSDEDGYVRRLIGPREGWGYWIWTTPPEYEMVVADRQGDRVVVHSKMRGDRRRHFYTFTLNGEEVDPRVEIPTPLGRKKAEHTFLLRRKKATEPDDAAE